MLPSESEEEASSTKPRRDEEEEARSLLTESRRRRLEARKDRRASVALAQTERTALCAIVACALLLVFLVWVATKVGATYAVPQWEEPPRPRRERCRRPRVLVTGFRQFSDVPNPSAAAAVALNGSCGRWHCVESHVVSVDSEGASFAARRAQSGKYAAILHLGLEDVSKGLKLEVAAKNVLGSRDNPPSFADADGCGPFALAVPGAPCLQVTTAPLDRMLLEDVPFEVWSRDPGAFFCNECYFRTLTAVRAAELTIPKPECLPAHVLLAPSLLPVLFVHLPDPDRFSLDDVVLPLLRQILDVLATPPLTTDILPTETIADLG